MKVKDARPMEVNRTSTLVALATFAVFIAGCGGGDDDTYEKMYDVAAHQNGCEGFLPPDLCLLVRESDTDDWSRLFRDIDGFNYQRGYAYRIRVEVDPPPEARADAVNDYSLEEVLERSPVPAGQTFEFSFLYAANAMEEIATGVYEVYGEERISCGPSECSSIDSLLTQQRSILFELRHPDDPADPLEISQILCSASPQSFRSSCLD
ncbi:DUF4377 domain-containing protein [Ectothiorhodospiraceae bacterium WFHF3C12]|nr:DUF4377 domain-containing protein [Ectothiorhodospiraceae bacterium WFHF3C12]